MEKKSTEERREEILSAALALAEEKDIDSIGIADIAAVIKLVPSAIYRHFSGKEQIIDGLLDFVSKTLQGNVRRVTAKEGSAIAKLQLLFEAHLKMIEEKSAIPRIMLSLIGNGKLETLKRKMQTIIAAYLDSVEQIIEEGRKNGELDCRDAGAAAVLFLSVIQSVAFMPQLVETRKVEPKRLWESVLHGLKPRDVQQ